MKVNVQVVAGSAGLAALLILGGIGFAVNDGSHDGVRADVVVVNTEEPGPPPGDLPPPPEMLPVPDALKPLLPVGFDETNCYAAGPVMPPGEPYQPPAAACVGNKVSPEVDFATITLFPSEADLNDAFSGIQDYSTWQPCSGNTPSPRPWTYAGTNGPGGMVGCTTVDQLAADGKPLATGSLLYSQSADLVLVELQPRPGVLELGSVIDYWANRSGRPRA